jgi:protein-tyrosine phosphatase
VARESPDYFPNDFAYKHLYIRDEIDEDITAYFEECFQFMDKCRLEGKNVLVHCIMGASRSASMVIYYLMRGEKMTLKDAFHMTKGKRPVVRPNPRFA